MKIYFIPSHPLKFNKNINATESMNGVNTTL